MSTCDYECVTEQQGSSAVAMYNSVLRQQLRIDIKEYMSITVIIQIRKCCALK